LEALHYTVVTGHYKFLLNNSPESRLLWKVHEQHASSKGHALRSNVSIRKMEWVIAFDKTTRGEHGSRLKGKCPKEQR